MTKYHSNKPERVLMLNEVIDIVDNQRNNEYGDPMEVIEKTAKMMELYLEASWRKPNQFVATDVVAFNEIQKIVRRSFNPLHEDSYKDTAGYSSIGYEYIRKYGDKLKKLIFRLNKS